MQVFLLPKEEFDSIQYILVKEYIKLDFICFVNELLFHAANKSDRDIELIAKNIVYVINKVLLDNVFKYITYKTPDKFIQLINNKNFSKDIDISIFYIKQVFEKTNIDLDYETEHIINKKLIQYIDRLYTNNTEFFNEKLIGIFDYMYRHFGYLDVSYYKFELYELRQPMLLLHEKPNEAPSHN